MESQQKIGKLYISKDIIDNTEARNTYYHNNTKSSRLRTSINHQKYQKTEPSVENIKEELPKKHSKNKTQFSEEYMSIVHKLKVNLSKQLQKQNKVEIVKERQYMFQNQNRERNKTFIHGKDNTNQKKYYHAHKDLYSSLNKRASFDFHREEAIKTLRFNNKPSLYESASFKTTEAVKGRESNLPLLTVQKERYNHKQPIQQVTEHNSPEKKIHKMVQKKDKGQNKLNKKKKKEKSIIFRYFQAQTPKQINQNQLYNQISPQFNKIDELCFHIQILLDILQRLNSRQQTQTITQSTIKSLKQYVLGNKKYINQQQKLLYDDISHLDQIYLTQSNQKHLRTMIFYQRVLIITCVDLLASSIFHKYKNDVDLILHSLLGIYIYFLSAYKQTKELSEYAVECLEYFQGKVTEHNIHTKREIATTVFFISKKIFPILKSNLTLFRQIKILAQQFQNRNVTINRSFYELLRLYAIYLNNNEDSIEKYHHTLKTFATCPSPYLTKPPQKPYTLVLDLDETLIHTHTEKQKFQIFMRPFLKEFLQVMARDFEIVIFTSSMPKYSEQIIAELPFIHHKLFRYHTTRLKSRHIKDLSRLGRPLECIVMIDNEQQNFILQRQNGIKIQPWTGSNPKDQQLNILGLFLNQMITKKPEDVREYIPSFKEFRKKYE